MDFNAAVEQFKKVLQSQQERAAAMRAQGGFVDYASLPKIVIGICGGDGIGPVITHEAERVLRFLLKEEVEAGRIEFLEIDGLTIENRAACGKAIPDDVMEQLRSCNVILKGPTTTPRAGDGMPNIESANVAMRKALDLFANVRPVKIPDEGIDWTFFRENTEGGYALGSQGLEMDDGVAFDFTVTTTEGTQRLPSWPTTTPARTAKSGSRSSPRRMSSRRPTASSSSCVRRSARTTPRSRPTTGTSTSSPRS